MNSRIDGRFRLERSLGAGAFGEAHLALDEQSGTQVVVKVLHAELADERLHLERFRREIAALRRLEHPHVVELTAWGVCPAIDQPYYVTTFSPGRPLDAILKQRKQLELERACRLMEQLLQALAHAHAEGIVHRDLKPANILVERAGEPDERVRLLDFGLVKLLAADLQPGEDLTGMQALGTPLYMSPEQCTGETITDKSDVYSTGVLLMELLTGEPLFEADTTLQLLGKHVEEPPPRLEATLPDAPAVLGDLLDEALAKGPEERPSAAAFGARLAALLAELEGGDPPPGPVVESMTAGGRIGPYPLGDELERDAQLATFRVQLGAGRPGFLRTVLSPSDSAALLRLSQELTHQQRRGAGPRPGRGRSGAPYYVLAESRAVPRPTRPLPRRRTPPPGTDGDLPWQRPESLRAPQEARCLGLLSGPWAGRLLALPVAGQRIRLGLPPWAELLIAPEDAQLPPVQAWIELRGEQVWVGAGERPGELHLGGRLLDPAGRQLPPGEVLRLGGVLALSGPLSSLRACSPARLGLRRLDRDAPRVSLDVPRYLGSAEGALPGPTAHGPEVAPLHARVASRFGRLVLEDLGSEPGTFRNGRRVPHAVVLQAGEELRLGPRGPRFRVESALGELPALERASTTPLPEQHPTRRVKLEVEHEGQVGRLFLFGGSRLRFGRNRRSTGARGNDLLLRPFPRAHESARELDQRIRRVSGQHGALVVSRDGIVVQDSDSTHGTALDGKRLPRGRPVALPASFLLDVADVVTLRGTAFRSLSQSSSDTVGAEGAHPVDAVRLERTRDGSHHTYVLLVREATLGSGELDALFLPQRGVRAGHARLVFLRGRFALQALRGDAPVRVSDHGTLGPGQLVVLEPGAEINLGGALLRFDEACDDDMKP